MELQIAIEPGAAGRGDWPVLSSWLFLILPGLSDLPRLLLRPWLGRRPSTTRPAAVAPSTPRGESGGEPCHGHGGAAAATHCSLRGAQDLPTDLLASLEALARPAVLAARRAADGPRPAGTIAESDSSVPASDGPPPPTPPPRLSSLST